MWQVYQDEGVIALAIASREDAEKVGVFAEQLGLSLPILLDTDGAVIESYPQAQAFPTAAYPQEWIIDPDGNIAYVANTFDHDAVIATIERLR